MKSYNIYLIRHGVTEANLKGQYAGVWDIPVCKEGEIKLHELKNNFKYPEIKECYSSPLCRCVKTAKIIYPDVTTIIREDLKEWNFGEWEGKTTNELLKDGRYVNWVENKRTDSTPGGESGIEFTKRVCSAFEEIVESLVKRGVTSAGIVTHGGVIMSLLATYGLPRKEFFEWITDNGCGFALRVTPSLWMRSKVAEVYNRVPVGNPGEISGNFKCLIDNLKE